MIGDSVVKTSRSGTRFDLDDVPLGDDVGVREDGGRGHQASGGGLVGGRVPAGKGGGVRRWRVLLGRVPGQGQEHVVERRPAQPDVVDPDTARRPGRAAPR